MRKSGFLKVIPIIGIVTLLGVIDVWRDLGVLFYNILDTYSPEYMWYDNNYLCILIRLKRTCGIYFIKSSDNDQKRINK